MLFGISNIIIIKFFVYINIYFLALQNLYSLDVSREYTTPRVEIVGGNS